MGALPGRREGGGVEERKCPSNRDNGIKREGKDPRLLTNKNKKVVKTTTFMLLHIGPLMLDVPPQAR